MAHISKGHRTPAVFFSFTALIIVVFSKEYITEFDKEDFWTKVPDGSQTQASWRRLEWKQNYNIPEPEGDRWLFEMAVDSGSSGTARVRSPEMRFTQGAFINITFWITSKWPESSNLRIYKTVRDKDEATEFLDLTSYSKPDNREWRQRQGIIPLGDKKDDKFKLTIYGYKSDSLDDAVVIDRVVINTDGKPPNPITSTTSTTSEATKPLTSTSTSTHTLTTTSEPLETSTSSSEVPYPLITTTTSQQLVTTPSTVEQVTTRSSESPSTILDTTAESTTTKDSRDTTEIRTTKDSRTTTDAARTTSVTTHTSEHLSSLQSSTEENETDTSTGSSIGTVEESIADDNSEPMQTIAGVLGAIGFLAIFLFVVVSIKKSKKEENEPNLVITGPVIERTVSPESIGDQQISDWLHESGSVLILRERGSN